LITKTHLSFSSYFIPRLIVTMSSSDKSGPQIPPAADGDVQSGAGKGVYVNQPTVRPDMIMAANNARNPANKPVDIDGKRKWTYNLFGCFDAFGKCCVALWCPCLIYSENKSRMRALHYSGQPHPTGGDLLSGDCCIYGLLACGCGSGWILDCILRAEEREREKISGDCCTDWLVSCFCVSCGQIQLSRELEAEEKFLMNEFIA